MLPADESFSRTFGNAVRHAAMIGPANCDARGKPCRWKRTLHFFALSTYDLRQALDAPQDRTRLHVKPLACSRGVHAASASLQQRYAELIFEVGDLLTQRRLRHMGNLCRARETAGIDDCHEITQLSEFHVAAPRWSVQHEGIRSDAWLFRMAWKPRRFAPDNLLIGYGPQIRKARR
jgi:hypothetical protein